MSWSPDQTGRMRGRPRRAPRYLVSVIPVTGAGGANFRFASYREINYSPIVAGVSVRWSSISPDTWQTSPSSAQVSLVGDVDWTGLRRGGVVVISVIEEGMSTADAVRVWVGRLWQIRAAGATTTIEAVGLDGALWTQAERGSDGQSFLSANTIGELTASWSTSDSTMSVTGIGTAPQKPVGEPYLLRIVRNNGVTFYVTATGVTGDPVTSFTGVVNGGLDSVPTNTGTGSSVQVVPYATLHPLVTAGRIVRGFGGWPANWCAGESPAYWDDARLTAVLAAPNVDPGPGWRWTVEAPIPRLADSLADLPAAGMGLVMRQGSVAPFAVLDPHTVDAGLIDPAHVAEVEWQAWDEVPSASGVAVRDRSRRPPNTYAANVAEADAWRGLAMGYRLLGLDPPTPTDIIADGGSDETRIALVPDHRPTGPIHQVGVPVYGTSDQRFAWRQSIALRLYRWHRDPPERLRVRLVGWHPYAAGDIVRLNYPAFRGRGGSGSTILRGAPLMVIGGGPDLGGASSTYDLAYVSADAQTVDD